VFDDWLVGRFRARLTPLAGAPVPVRPMVSVGLVALLLTVSEPVRVPVAVGRKVTETVQEAPAAMELPQVLACV